MTEEILANFGFKGHLVSCQKFGSGHINKTYLALYKTDDGSEKQYVLQQINTNAFQNVDVLMDNVFAVTSYLRGQIKAAGGDADRETLHYIHTTDGKKYYRAPDGTCYRAYVFVKDSVSHDSVDSPELFKKSGMAFGRFQSMLSAYPAETLHETIPNFHNTKWRYAQFEKAVEANLSGRRDTCLPEIEFVRARKADCAVLVDMIDRGELPIRVTHNDTKLNNVMFDQYTGDCVCVIDLDTVMPGLALYDFGDSIRFGANTAGEDETDLSKVSISLDYFRAYTEGFLSACGTSLTDKEIENLAFSAKLMTLECGMRFLTDYLDGDTYFGTAYPEHNLVRARDQFKLVEDMEKHMPEMQAIVQEVSAAYKD